MAVKSRTKTGIEVTLTGTEYCGHPTVRVEFDHPTAGQVRFESEHYGAIEGQEGIVGHWRGKRAGVTVPRADFDAAMAEARAIGERQVADLKSGAAKIRVSYSDGEYLSGYAAHGRAADLLRSLGLAKDVDGWGTLVDDAAVKALGEEFAYAEAAEFARPALEAEKAKEEAARHARREKFAESRRVGKPVVLETWTEGCCERDFDCSLDVVAEYALPDGTTRTERTHTH